MRRSNESASLWMLGVAILALQALATYGLARDEYFPSPPPLDGFPRTLGAWELVQEETMEPAVYEMLAPDEFLNRNYRTAGFASEVNLFVAYYKTQHRARNAHDPKVCLPGSGWEPHESRTIRFDAQSVSRSVEANYYRIRKGPLEAVVLYWYQTHKGTIAFEQSLRLRRIVDTILDRRTDMALVRIVVPVSDSGPSGAAERAIQFAGLTYVELLGQFPARPAGEPSGG